MTASLILSKLRFESFNHEFHTPEHEHPFFPGWAIIPNVLTDGSPNPRWIQATHCAISKNEGFEVAEIGTHN